MKQLQTILTYITIAIALIILVDFIGNTSEVTERIVAKKSQHQSYNNAGGNSHVSFSIVTEHTNFNCSKEFFETLENESLIKVNNSLLFNKVNSVENITTKQKETYSLRYASGLVIPLVVLLILILSLVKSNLSDILKFVTKVVIIADLFFILLF